MSFSVLDCPHHRTQLAPVSPGLRWENPGLGQWYMRGRDSAPISHHKILPTWNMRAAHKGYVDSFMNT